MMRKLRKRRTEHHCRIIHLLNQRYHQEFIRAERLQADLDLLQAFRATWLFRVLRWLRGRLHRARAAVEEGAIQPLQMQPVQVCGRVSIIIPFRDQGELLADCLASLRLGTYQNYEVVLVDNGSTEKGLLRFLARLEQRRRYRVIHDPESFNFSRLCNQGAQAACGDWFLFLNNDTCVLTPDWLEQLITTALQPGVGIAGATLLYPDGTLQHAGMYRRGSGVWDHCGRGELPESRAEFHQVRCVAAVSAACLLIGRELFQALHGFDESRPVTHNDVDLCRRAWAAGRRVVVTPHARLLHFESLTRGYTLTPEEP